MYCKKNAGRLNPAFYDSDSPYDIGQTEARYFQLTA